MEITHFVLHILRNQNLFVFLQQNLELISVH